ncbi:hypothetical protein, partial [Escherichia coli]|uniref:hypothetical protein n=1 Tax=Escherichia coli TaxID=562 RepID=UPI00197E1CD3
ATLQWHIAWCAPYLYITKTPRVKRYWYAYKKALTLEGKEDFQQSEQVGSCLVTSDIAPCIHSLE